MGFVAAFFGISFLIFFHELGHFLCARLFGVKVLVFSIGFGKKILSYDHKGTQYALSLIPLGGYVKLKGEMTKDSIGDNAEHKNTRCMDCDSLFAKHPLARIAILFAGPFFNLLLAFLLYVFVFANGIPSYSKKPIVGSIGTEFEAAKFLQENDIILRVNGKSVAEFSDITKILNPESSSTNEHTESKKATLLIARPPSKHSPTKLPSAKTDSMHDFVSETNMQKLELTIPLAKEEGRVILGISPLMEMQHVAFFALLQKAAITLYDNTIFIFQGIQDLLLGLVGIENISGVIGITDVSAKVYDTSFLKFMLLLAIISINLAIINFLPLPMLDGGQILFTLYEWIAGREVHEKVAGVLIAFGFSCIICLMLLGAYNDIVRILAR